MTPNVNEATLLAALHPTPAVCGAPRAAAASTLRDRENFDRGFYAGPFGWLGAGGADFSVAIRSGLLTPASAISAAGRNARAGTQLVLFAGVGVVRGAQPANEWQELELKVSQFERLLLQPPTLLEAPNLNILWATLIVEELVRLGVELFALAPGSRSTPLALAAARHPRARCIVCLDERSLAFHALGFAKAGRGLAAVITSSGTAVANLLPACVEAYEAQVPLIFLTADRPPELRNSGANQTINQARGHVSQTV